jgi:hypothetical protein
MAIENSFVNLDLATVQELKSKFVECLAAIAVAGQSYTISGRTYTRANLNDVNKTVAELAAAEQFLSGKLRRRTYANFQR